MPQFAVVAQGLLVPRSLTLQFLPTLFDLHKIPPKNCGAGSELNLDTGPDCLSTSVLGENPATSKPHFLTLFNRAKLVRPRV
jgi:hypothetical protein